MTRVKRQVPIVSEPCCVPPQQACGAACPKLQVTGHRNFEKGSPPCTSAPSQRVHVRLILLTPYVNEEQRAGEINARKKLECSTNISHGKCRIKQINLNNTFCIQEINKKCLLSFF